MPDPQRRFLRDFSLAMAAYAGAALLGRRLLPLAGETWWRVPAAVLPVLPMVPAVYIFLRYLNAIDELQQKIQLNAIGFSASLTGLLTLAVGFLENAGLPRPPWTFVFPLMVALWSVGVIWFTRRYS